MWDQPSFDAGSPNSPTGFVLEQAIGQSDFAVVFTSDSISVTSTTLNNLVGDTLSAWRLRARNPAGLSPPSLSVSASTPSVPVAPRLSATRIGALVASLNWDSDQFCHIAHLVLDPRSQHQQRHVLSDLQRPGS
eukprot:TRINITY_DN1580_c0_g1_i9.p1 TRINITY_DN1580_c0_g1~~TRINITY_DN1580_c0_g1_i9.p1  ORF type:complete len:134 (-),score=34.32 TRINITY_DN1580_c0_g1_i9:611-1012(-)